MNAYFEKVYSFAQRLGLDILQDDMDEELVVVTNEEKGVYHMVIDCEFPILIFEQLIYEIENFSAEHFIRLLQMNRNLIHGSFVVDEERKNVIFRDTLQLENLDFNEFEGTINALTMGLAEYSAELLSLNKA